MSKKEEKSESTAIATSVVTDTLPAFLQDQQGPGRGSEAVTTDDITIPRLELVQDLSPILKKDKPNYNPDAEVGDFYNSVTNQVYGPQVMVVPVLFRKVFNVWKDRKAGGGFRGSFPDELAARLHSEQLNSDGEGPTDVIDTAEHFCLLIRDDGNVEEIMVSMTRTKLTASRNWNSLVRLNGGDRFSRAYALSSFTAKNAKGEFYNIRVSNAGFPTEPLYRRAEALYEEISKKGANLKGDYSDADGHDQEAGPSEF